MTRIVGGQWSGRRLDTPPGTGTRPTSERVRAALANSLAAVGGLTGARVLDLYCGSGALGLELLSRGAACLDLVERDPAALTAARRNVETLTGGGRTRIRVINADVVAFASSTHPQPYDLVLADPPYRLPAGQLAGVLTALHDGGALAPGADLVLERAAADGDFDWPPPLLGLRYRRYGDSALCYGRAP